jgi:aminoglycoside phosphotransferase (APT) family kinase protein
MADELRILHERLPTLAQGEAECAGAHATQKRVSARRIERLLAACDRLGAATPEPVARGIHRDFYADQVIVDGMRLYLIDFDLYCEGDPGLDIGNFLGHMTEQSLRTLGDPGALVERERAMEERFVELAGEAARAAVRAYATLTLARHIYLSTQFPERRPFTGSLLELCEERLNRSGAFL